MPVPFNIADLAAAYRYKPNSDEQILYDIGSAARKEGYYTRSEVYTITHWKAHRRSAIIKQQDEQYVEYATRQAFAYAEPVGQLRLFTSIGGIGVAVASTLLHFARPDSHIIIDVRPRETLGLKKKALTPPDYATYRAFCVKEAEQHGVTLRALDKAIVACSTQLRELD